MYWSESLGRIELKITKAQAESCSHPGPCDSDVADLRKAPSIRRQLDKLSPERKYFSPDQLKSIQSAIEEV